MEDPVEDLDDESPIRSRVLLIDLDNCPNEMAKLGADLQGFSRIVGCYAGPEPKIGLGLVPTLAASMAEGRLELVAMKTGHNAADFGLAFWAGRLLETLPEDTEFVVLSRDKDLDRVVELLRGCGRAAARIVTNGTRRKKALQAPNDEIARSYADFCLSNSGGNPKTRKTLRNSIKNYLKGERIPAEPDRVIDSLVEAGLVELYGQKAIYSPRSLPDPDNDPDDIPF